MYKQKMTSSVVVSQDKTRSFSTRNKSAKSGKKRSVLESLPSLSTLKAFVAKHVSYIVNSKPLSSLSKSSKNKYDLEFEREARLAVSNARLPPNDASTAGLANSADDLENLGLAPRARKSPLELKINEISSSHRSQKSGISVSSGISQKAKNRKESVAQENNSTEAIEEELDFMSDNPRYRKKKQREQQAANGGAPTGQTRRKKNIRSPIPPGF